MSNISRPSSRHDSLHRAKSCAARRRR
jgi:hypothetical protein